MENSMGGRRSNGKSGGLGRSGSSSTGTTTRTQILKGKSSNYQVGESLSASESPKMITIKSTGTVMSKRNRVDTLSDTINSDGSVTRTNILRDSKGNLYSVSRKEKKNKQGGWEQVGTIKVNKVTKTY